MAEAKLESEMEPGQEEKAVQQETESKCGIPAALETEPQTATAAMVPEFVSRFLCCFCHSCSHVTSPLAFYVFVYLPACSNIA